MQPKYPRPGVRSRASAPHALGHQSSPGRKHTDHPHLVAAETVPPAPVCTPPLISWLTINLRNKARAEGSTRE